MDQLEILIGNGSIHIEDIECLHDIDRLLDDYILLDKNVPESLHIADSRTTPKSAKLVTFQTLLKVAASICLLAIAFWSGQKSNSNNDDLAQIEGELTQLKEMMMLNLLEQDNSNSRLKAVSLTNDLEQMNEPIVSALLERVQQDPSDNVRIACIEALIPFTDQEQVRKGLAASVAHQESPLVLLSLAEALRAGGQIFSVDSIKKTLPEGLPPGLIKDFEEGLKVFM